MILTLLYPYMPIMSDRILALGQRLIGRARHLYTRIVEMYTLFIQD